ncbi:hypothetical protein EO087_03395 [Dyella sp. M7H15-1]|uniref:hypothetical protein n=1 Tax=Dyella sp. M7H15-1 TaxID=2501295 RepID=UPI001004DE5F|nr:hypothetical protein [Dyella sp. M7H15-1]QAU23150.1 hypothetical protein EO087_03395 [Dyella sp. M7H15-1]
MSHFLDEAVEERLFGGLHVLPIDPAPPTLVQGQRLRWCHAGILGEMPGGQAQFWVLLDGDGFGEHEHILPGSTCESTFYIYARRCLI